MNQWFAKLDRSSYYYNPDIIKSRLRKYRTAILAYDRAIEIDPRLIDTYINRGNAKAKLGRTKAAIDDYNLAIFLDVCFNNYLRAKETTFL